MNREDIAKLEDERYRELLIRRTNFQDEQSWNDYDTQLDELLASIAENIKFVKPNLVLKKNWYIRKYKLGIKALKRMLEATNRAVNDLLFIRSIQNKVNQWGPNVTTTE